MTEYGWRDASATCAHAYLLDKVLQEVPASPCRIADLGCGNGYLAGVLARLGHAVIGIDRAPEGIEAARAAHPTVSFVCAPIGDPRIDELEPVDLVISTEVIEHLYYPRELLRTAYKLLKPGGRVVLSTPYHGYAKNLAIALANGFDKHVTAHWDGGHIKFFSTRTLSAIVREAGFVEPRFRFAGRLPLLWKSMIVTATRPR